VTSRRRSTPDPAGARAEGAYAAAILDAALDAVVTIDHLGRVLEFNSAAERSFGYSRNEVLGRELAELDRAGQGFHFARPLPADAFGRLLEQQERSAAA
jgi:PAS domain-containing protein